MNQNQPQPPRPPKLVDQVRQIIRTRHMSKRTEEAYVHWINWQYLFPARNLSHDPRPREADGEFVDDPTQLRRHHVHENTVQKAIKRAAVRWIGWDRRFENSEVRISTLHWDNMHDMTILVGDGFVDDLNKLIAFNCLDFGDHFVSVGPEQPVQIASLQSVLSQNHLQRTVFVASHFLQHFG